MTGLAPIKIKRIKEKGIDFEKFVRWTKIIQVQNQRMFNSKIRKD